MAVGTPGLQPLDVPNLRDQIEQTVRNAISNGTFKPGDRIVETMLADQLQVSRAPIREALSVLEHEGVVTSHPRRGYFVTDFSDKDIDEIYSFRILLECEALRRTIECFTAEDIHNLQLIVDQITEAIAQGTEFYEIVALDFEFHEYICRGANHSRLYSTWSSMRWQTITLMGVTTKTHYSTTSHPQDLRHQHILDAIAARGLVKAQTALAAHIREGEKRARHGLQTLRVPEPVR